MHDEELKRLLSLAGWRLFFTYENGEEEFTGSSDSETPNLSAIRALVDAAMAAEREACALACEAVHTSPIQGAHEEYIAGKEMALQQAARAIRMRSNAMYPAKPAE